MNVKIDAIQTQTHIRRICSSEDLEFLKICFDAIDDVVHYHFLGAEHDYAVFFGWNLHLTVLYEENESLEDILFKADNIISQTFISLDHEIDERKYK